MPKLKKDPKAPKRPLSAYLFYSIDRRPQLKEQSPDLKFGDFGRIIGMEWREMSEEEKQPYLDKAEVDKKRYEEEKSTYRLEAQDVTAAKIWEWSVNFNGRLGKCG